MRHTYAQHNRRDPAREKLIADHLDMARRIALRVGRRVPDWLSQDDLVSSAMVGLTEAADRFDAGRGEPFVAFAERRIRGAVLDELRRGDLLPRRVRATQRKVVAVMRKLEHTLGRKAEDEEVAAALGVTLEQYREELEMLSHINVVEHTVDERGHGVGAQTDVEPTPERRAEHGELAELLRKNIALLPERDALILSLYYVEELSYSDIGEILGVSESRVCQLHGRALATLRSNMSRHDDLEEAA